MHRSKSSPLKACASSCELLSKRRFNQLPEIMHNSLLLAQLPFNALWLVGWAVLGVVILVFIIVVSTFASIWIRAWTSGAPVGIVELIALRLRRVPVGMLVDTRITAVKS